MWGIFELTVLFQDDLPGPQFPVPQRIVRCDSPPPQDVEMCTFPLAFQLDFRHYI